MNTKLHFAVLAAAAFTSFGAHAQDGAADPWSPTALAARANAGAIHASGRHSDGGGYRDEWSPEALRARLGGKFEGTTAQSGPRGAGYQDEWSPAALAARFQAAAQHTDAAATTLHSTR